MITAKPRVVLLLALLGIVGCRDAAAPLRDAVLILRNQRTDTIASVFLQECADQGATSVDSLQVRDQLVPRAERQFVLTPACYDARLANPRDSIVDQRTNLRVEAGDTLIVLLVPE